MTRLCWFSVVAWAVLLSLSPALALAGELEVKDPPLVQVLIPGFSVRELPLELRNVNNLRYRADGKLYALGYDGDVWLLSDTDVDGLEETSTRFFENRGRLRGPIGMQVIPAGHPLLSGTEPAVQKARGVVVASKGKISALLDMDGDDVAEVERVIATGWKEIPQNVDAIGIAFDPKDGAIFFGLGTAAYNNAYQVDDQGKAAFDLKSDRGTIQRLDAKTLERTTVCTGVRFSIGMEFSAAGDLFVSEQEGATWLSNGNPFDELLHIRPGQHYGFPPRHPKHLPNVFDEPSEFDYRPQHQSTCGICFNLPHTPGGPTFGPPEWRGDLFVTGESRGKLYRTRIVKDRSGRYVADNQLIACLSMLTVDCCLSPKGDLLIACHSGGPDWGTGPTGTGKIFRASYDQPELPRPLGVWLAGPQELRIPFSSPLDPQHLKNLAQETKITYGDYVAAGDRFETLHPGYAVVKLQTEAPRFDLPVYAVSVTPDRKELILTTAPHTLAVGYAVQLPGLGRGPATPGTLPQHAAVDLAYTLNGVQADWRSLRSEVREGWQRPLPHLDLSLTEPLKWPTGIYPAESGSLSLRTRIDLRGLFRPVTQPGSQLDYEPGTDQFIKSRSIVFRSKFNLLAIMGEDERTFAAEKQSGGFLQARVPIESETTESLLFHISRLVSPEFPSDLEVEWHVELADGSTRSGPIALRRFFLPWAELKSGPSQIMQDIVPPELASASWGRGRRVFHSEEAGCAKCHLAGADGRRIGPDLGNLRHRDLASVRRDITQPSFAINPDYLGYTVALKNGRVLTGTLHNDGDDILLGDKDGKTVRVARSDVDLMQPATVSVMPEGIHTKLHSEKMNDLLAYLLLAPPRMPADAKELAPPPRSRAEVAAVLEGSTPLSTPLKPLNILLVAGAKDHGPGEHDYPAWLREWSKLLEAGDGVTVSTAMEWPTAEQVQAADTIAFFQRGSWNAERATAIDAHLKKGGGLVYIHWAVEGGAEAPAFAQRIGLASDARKIKYRHGPLDLGFETGSKHPVGRNFDKLHLHDESYWLLPGDAARINVLASGEEEGASRPLFWTLESGGGRVFVSIPGHYSWTFDDPLFRVLLLRGIAWSASEPVDRFNDLVPLGVTYGD